MVEITWPEHRELPVGGRKSDFDAIYPGVARAMQEQGMESLRHLVERIEWIVRQPWGKQAFDVAPHSTSIRNIIVESGNDSPFSVLENGYTETAALIAFALESTPEELFGDPDSVLAGYFARQAKLRDDVVPLGASDEVVRDELLDVLGQAMQFLTDEQRYVAERRFGLNGQEQQTLKTIAADMGVHKDTVRQLEARACRKLKYAPMLQDYAVGDHPLLGHILDKTFDAPTYMPEVA